MERRVGEVAAGGLQAQAADPGGDCGVFVPEEAVQVAGGDVVRGGDGGRGEVRVVQVLPDERLDPQGEGLSVGLRGRQSPASSRWAKSAATRSFRTVPSRGPSEGWYAVESAVS